MFLVLKLILIFELIYSYTFSKKVSSNILGVISGFLLVTQNLVWGIAFSFFSLLSLFHFKKRHIIKVFTFLVTAIYFNWATIIKYVNISFGTFFHEEDISNHDSIFGLILLFQVWKNEKIAINPRLIFIGEKNLHPNFSIIHALLLIICSETLFLITQNVFFGFNQTNIIQTWLGILSFIGIILGLQKIIINKVLSIKWVFNYLINFIPKPKTFFDYVIILGLIPLLTKLPIYQWCSIILLIVIRKYNFHKRSYFVSLILTFVLVAVILTSDFQKFKEVLISMVNPIGLLRFYNELYLTYVIGMDLLLVPFFVVVFVVLLYYKFTLLKKIIWLEPILVLLLLLGIYI